MGFFWVILTAAFLLAAFAIGFRWAVGRRARPALRPENRADGPPARDLGANINPSQHGNERDLWPDRTGAQTRTELGAKHAANVTYVGDREEQPGPHEHRPGTDAAADFAPEDEFGEDRPANRTTAPDNPPTQWHPDEHGVMGDHVRDGHHTSASAPEKISTAHDPYAHAPVPGPNHIIPDSGNELPRDVRP